MQNYIYEQEDEKKEKCLKRRRIKSSRGKRRKSDKVEELRGRCRRRWGRRRSKIATRGCTRKERKKLTRRRGGC